MDSLHATLGIAEAQYLGETSGLAVGLQCTNRLRNLLLSIHLSFGFATSAHVSSDMVQMCSQVTGSRAA